MKITLVTHRYRPNIGGVEEHVEQVATRLAERGHNILVVTADRDGLPAQERIDSVTVKRRASLAPGGNVHLAPASLLDGRRDGVVHVHNYHSAPAVLAALGATGRVVFTPHYHGEASNAFTRLLFGPYRILGHKAVRSSDEVIAVSRQEQKLLEEDFGVDAPVIPHGLDYRGLMSADPVNIGSEYALFIGRLKRYKNIEPVIRALEHCGLDLVVVGEGPDMERLEQAARGAGLENRVIFAGRVDEERLDGLYQGASLLVNLSDHEAFGMTVGEALARSTPVLVNRGSGLKWWTEKEGVTGTSESGPKAIATEMEWARGRSVNDKPLPSWDEVVDDLEVVYS